ncbi:MAG TPA: hypothetical protein VM695_10175 [Phycisphaerae bacterium]|nr:hypothetical protein [Phycisphaerae bacterium]
MALYNPWGTQSPLGTAASARLSGGGGSLPAMSSLQPRDALSSLQFGSDEQARGKREQSYEQALGIMGGLAGFGGGGAGGAGTAGGLGGGIQGILTPGLLTAARESIQRNLNPETIQSQFSPDVANLIGGQAKETAAAQYGEQERKLREALANKSIGQGEFMTLMSELQRNRVGAEQEAYRTPRIEQAKYGGEFALKARESEQQSQQLALAALQSIWGQMFGAQQGYATMLANAPYQGTDYSQLGNMAYGGFTDPGLLAAVQAMGGAGVNRF